MTDLGCVSEKFLKKWERRIAYAEKKNARSLPEKGKK